jgi:hypothetical protein
MAPVSNQSNQECYNDGGMDVNVPESSVNNLLHR